MIPNNTPFKLLTEGDIQSEEKAMHTVDKDSVILSRYEILLMAAMDNLIGS